MRIGIHCSTGGSLERAAIQAHDLGANAFQIFSASPRMWRTRRPDPEQVGRLRGFREQHDLWPLVIHGSYLINLGAPPCEIREKSIDGFCGEIERALLIGADYLVVHPGSYKGLTVEEGILQVAEGMTLAWRSVDPVLARGAKLQILLENTAGAGCQLGGQLEELAAIRKLVTPYIDVPVGFCLDTCHCYVAGFDIAKRRGLSEFVGHAQATLGLEHVPVLHANDAKMTLGSRLDRHANIGAGYIGLEGFRRILNHPELRNKAFILETPVDNPGDDRRNVAALKELVSPNDRSTTTRSSRSGTRAGAKTPRST